MRTEFISKIKTSVFKVIFNYEIHSVHDVLENKRYVKKLQTYFNNVKLQKRFDVENKTFEEKNTSKEHKSKERKKFCFAEILQGKFYFL